MRKPITVCAALLLSCLFWSQQGNPVSAQEASEELPQCEFRCVPEEEWTDEERSNFEAFQAEQEWRYIEALLCNPYELFLYEAMLGDPVGGSENSSLTAAGSPTGIGITSISGQIHNQMMIVQSQQLRYHSIQILVTGNYGYGGPPNNTVTGVSVGYTALPPSLVTFQNINNQFSPGIKPDGYQFGTWKSTVDDRNKNGNVYERKCRFRMQVFLLVTPTSIPVPLVVEAEIPVTPVPYI